MARNKETFTYEIKAEANTTQAENKINSLVDKINSSANKGTVDTKGIDEAIKKMEKLKKKSIELVMQNEQLRNSLYSSAFDAKEERKANKIMYDNIKQLQKIKDEVTSLRNEYKKLGVDLDNAKLSTNTAKSSANISNEIRDIKELNKAYLDLAQTKHRLQNKLNADSGNEGLKNKLNNVKAQMQALKDIISEVDKASSNAASKTKSVAKAQPVETVVQPKVTKPIEAEVNPVMPKKIGEKVQMDVIPNISTKEFKEKPLKLPVNPQFILKQYKENPIKLPVIPQLKFDKYKENQTSIPIKAKVNMREFKQQFQDVAIPLKVSEAKLTSALNKIEDARKKLGHKNPLEVYFEAKNADFLLHRIQEYEFLRDNKMTRQPLVVNMKLSSTAEEIINRIENLKIKINLTDFRKQLGEVSKILNEVIPQPIRRTLHIELDKNNSVTSKIDNELKNHTVRIKINLLEEAVATVKDRLNKLVANRTVYINPSVLTSAFNEQLDLVKKGLDSVKSLKITAIFDDSIIKEAKKALKTISKYVSENPIILKFNTTELKSVYNAIKNPRTKPKIVVDVVATKKSINDVFKFVRDEIAKKASPKIVVNVVTGKNPFREVEQYILGYIKTVDRLNKYKLNVNVDLGDAPLRLSELKYMVNDIASAKNNIKIRVDYSDVTKTIKALMKVVDLINSLPSANIKISNFGGGGKRKNNGGGGGGQPPIPPPAPPSGGSGGSGTPPIQQFITLRQQLEDAIKAADKAWQAGGRKTSADFEQAKAAVDAATRSLIEFNRAAGQISLSRQASDLERMAAATNLHPQIRQQLLNEAKLLREEQQRIREMTKPNKWLGPQGYAKGANASRYNDSTNNSVKTLSGMPGFMGERVEQLAYAIRFSGRSSKGFGSFLEATSQLMVDVNRVKNAYLQDAENARQRLAAANREIRARSKEDARQYLAENPGATGRDAVRFMRQRRQEYAKQYNTAGIQDEIDKAVLNSNKFGGKVSTLTKIGGALAVIGTVVTGLQSIVGVASTLYNAFDFLTGIIKSVGMTMYQLLKPGIELYAEQQSALFSFTASLMSNAKVGGSPVDQATAMGVSKGLIQRAMLDAEMSAFSLEEILRSLQGTMPMLLNLGMNAEQAYEVNKGVAGVAKMIQLTPSQILQETRDLAQGSITSRGSQVANTLGITNQDLNKFGNDATARFNFLMERFKNFSNLLNEFEDTALGRWQQLQERWQATAMKMVEGIAPLFKGLFEDIIKETGRYQDANGNYLDAITGKWYNAKDQIIATQDDIKKNGYAAYGIDANSLGFQLSEAFAAARDEIKDIIIYIAQLVDDTVKWTAEFFNIEQSGNGIKDVIKVAGKIFRVIVSLAVGLYKMLVRYSDVILVIINAMNVVVSLFMGAIAAVNTLCGFLSLGLGIIEGIYRYLKLIAGFKWGKMDAKGNVTWEEDKSKAEWDNFKKEWKQTVDFTSRNMDAAWQSGKNIFDPVGQFTVTPSGNGGFLTNAVKRYDGKVVDGSDKAKNTNLTLKDMQGTYNKQNAEAAKALKKYIQDMQKVLKAAISSLKTVLDNSLKDLKEIREKNELDFKQGLKPMADYYSEKAALDKAEAVQRLQELEIQKELLLQTPFANPYEAAKEAFSLDSQIREQERVLGKANDAQSDVARIFGKVSEVESNVEGKMRETAEYFKGVAQTSNQLADKESALLDKQGQTFDGIEKNMKDAADSAVSIDESLANAANNLQQAAVQVSNLAGQIQSTGGTKANNTSNDELGLGAKASAFIYNAISNTPIFDGQNLSESQKSVVADILKKSRTAYDKEWMAALKVATVTYESGINSGAYTPNDGGSPSIGMGQFKAETARWLSNEYNGGVQLDPAKVEDSIRLMDLYFDYLAEAVEKAGISKSDPGKFYSSVMLGYMAGEGGAKSVGWDINRINSGTRNNILKRFKLANLLRSELVTGLKLNDSSSYSSPPSSGGGSGGTFLPSQNIEDAGLRKTAPQLVAALEETFYRFREKYNFDPFVVSGGTRSVANNNANNGKRNSHHLAGKDRPDDTINSEFGDAVDLIVDERVRAEVEKYLADAYGYYILHHNAGSGLHTHVDTRNKALGGAGGARPAGKVFSAAPAFKRAKSAREVQNEINTKVLQDIMNQFNKDPQGYLKYIDSKYLEELIDPAKPLKSEMGVEIQQKLIDELTQLLEGQISLAGDLVDTTELRQKLMRVKKAKQMVVAKQANFSSAAMAQVLAKMYKEELDNHYAMLEKQAEYIFQADETKFKYAMNEAYLGNGGFKFSAPSNLGRYKRYYRDDKDNPFAPAKVINEMWDDALKYIRGGYVQKAQGIRQKIVEFYDRLEKHFKDYLDMIESYFSNYKTWLDNSWLTPLQKERGNREITAREGDIKYNMYTYRLASLQGWDASEQINALEKQIESAKDEVTKKEIGTQIDNLRKNSKGEIPKLKEALDSSIERYNNLTKSIEEEKSKGDKANTNEVSKLEVEQRKAYESAEMYKLDLQQLELLEKDYKIKQLLADQQRNNNEYILRAQLESKKALEDGLVTFLTDGVNSGDIGGAIKEFAINYLKAMQKFFAQEMVTSMMTNWFPARRKENGEGLLGSLDEYAKASDYDRMFNNSEVNSQFMQDKANFTIISGIQKVDVMNANAIGDAVGADKIIGAVEDTTEAVGEQAESAQKVADEMARARPPEGNELIVHPLQPVSYQQMPEAPVNYNLQSKMVSGMGNYKFIQSLFGNSFVQALGSLFAVKTLFTGDTKEKLLSMLFLELQLIYNQLVNMGNSLVEIATLLLMQLMIGRQRAQFGTQSQYGVSNLNRRISDGQTNKTEDIIAIMDEAVKAESKSGRNIFTKIADTQTKSAKTQEVIGTNVASIKTSTTNANGTTNAQGGSGIGAQGANSSPEVVGKGETVKGGASGISAKNGNFGFVQNLFGNSFMQLAGTAFSLKTLFSGDDKEKLLSMIYIELQLIYSAINSMAVFGGFAKGGLIHAANGFTFQNRSNGLVSGPGTSTSDSIPAMLSDGEAVLNARAVRQLGINFINAVNNGNFSRIRTKPMHLASGGVIGNAQQSTARGMTDFARNVGTNVSTTNNMSVALVRDENEAMKHFMRSPEGQKILVDFQRGNGRVFTRF